MYPSTLLADPVHPADSRARLGARLPTRDGVTRRAARPRRPVRWRWLGVAAVLALAIGGLGYLRTWPPLATVMSASMAPTIDTGDIVVLKRLERARAGRRHRRRSPCRTRPAPASATRPW